MPACGFPLIGARAGNLRKKEKHCGNGHYLSHKLPIGCCYGAIGIFSHAAQRSVINRTRYKVSPVHSCFRLMSDVRHLHHILDIRDCCRYAHSNGKWPTGTYPILQPPIGQWQSAHSPALATPLRGQAPFVEPDRNPLLPLET